MSVVFVRVSGVRRDAQSDPMHRSKHRGSVCACKGAQLVMVGHTWAAKGTAACAAHVTLSARVMECQQAMGTSSGDRLGIVLHSAACCKWSHDEQAMGIASTVAASMHAMEHSQ